MPKSTQLKQESRFGIINKKPNGKEQAPCSKNLCSAPQSAPAANTANLAAKPRSPVVFTVRKKGLCAKCPSAGITGMTLCAVCQSGPRNCQVFPRKILRFDPFLLVLCASIRAMPPQPSSVSKSLPCVQKCLMALRRLETLGINAHFKNDFVRELLLGPPFFYPFFVTPGRQKTLSRFSFSFGHSLENIVKWFISMNESDGCT